MEILPSRFLSVVKKYVNFGRSFLGRRVSNRRRSTSIGIVYPSVDTYRMHFWTFFRSTFTFLRRQAAIVRDIIFREQLTKDYRNQSKYVISENDIRNES